MRYDVIVVGAGSAGNVLAAIAPSDAELVEESGHVNPWVWTLGRIVAAPRREWEAGRRSFPETIFPPIRL
jgi:thioredoxin reductase